jgi:hypothetical protein
MYHNNASDPACAANDYRQTTDDITKPHLAPSFGTGILGVGESQILET